LRLLLVACFLLSGTASAREPVGVSGPVGRLMALEQALRDDYPDVTHISVAQLKRDYADALLIDVRAAEEFEVSRLPGAYHAPSMAEIEAVLAAHPGRQPVFYCSVGIRSAEAAQALQQQTDKTIATVNPVNLAGSLFAWANSGEPLENATGPTGEVHPYNVWWGMRFLDPDRPVAAVP